MIYQLANGNTIEIPIEVFLEMSDDDLKNLETYNVESSIENPFYNSTLEDFDS